jgi:hypothetical protein
VSFSLRLRVPEWALRTKVSVNGEAWTNAPVKRLLTLNRTWNEGDIVTLDFAAEVRTSRWVENSVAVERGPLVYALRIEEDWRHVKATDSYGDYYELHPKSPWNYALAESCVNAPDKGFKLVRRSAESGYPWSLKTAPMELRTQGRRLANWQLYNHRAGPLPHGRSERLQREPADEIVLLPYGCTRLRITEFPVAK